MLIITMSTTHSLSNLKQYHNEATQFLGAELVMLKEVIPKITDKRLSEAAILLISCQQTGFALLQLANQTDTFTRQSAMLARAFMETITTKVSTPIDTVIFDLGGVLFDIDYKLTQDAFIKLGSTADFREVYSQQQQAGIFDEFEKGNITPAQFREGLRKWLPAGTTDPEIDNAWCALLIGFPHHKVELLNKLKGKYKLYLLSNTNEIHLPEVMKMIDNMHAPGQMGKLFLKEYYSCRMKLRKPEKDIYETVTKENNLTPETTLFVDDLIQNIEGAKVTGLQTLHCTPDVVLADYFGE
jgi:glucose-1-phosphatase